MMHFLYRVVYNAGVNKVLRSANKALSFLPFQLPPSGVIDVSVDGIHFGMETNQTSFVSRVVYYHGAKAFEYTPLFTRLIRRCHTFVDIGANIGYYSLLAAKCNPDLQVVAFEPAPGPFTFLRKNVQRNSLTKNIQCSALALSDKSGQMDFFIVRNPKYPDIPNLGGVGSLLNQGMNREKVTVELSTLDAFVSTHPMPAIDLIKMDTEGTEDHVLKGARETIRRDKPIVICETLFNRIEPALEAEMNMHGYKFYNHVRGRLVRVDTLVRSADDGVRDCFFVHPDKEEWIREFIG